MLFSSVAKRINFVQERLYFSNKKQINALIIASYCKKNYGKMRPDICYHI